MTTIHLQVAPRVGPTDPRGARLAAALYLALARGLSALRNSVRARASNPAQDLLAVRELAQSCRESDPSFAADLSAAADRYEQLLGRA